ncbi:serine/threonine protein phosphatase [Paenibacillus oenotherae]|uniref:Serine/threonine protein phosphatase n=2 Tax=Paenibacillus oenotherae TaxID=1435645 RepID=A0ABS7DB42_9BACL|nr:metallophosphoesterase family protein [Paenibacillus oenotherae]MBW7476968.1 serine/threonine protein phosphatase [Paenibacillus oenotherae]
MERTLVISDIHGCYEQFQSLLNLAGYHPSSDKLILIGDYVDRGPASKEVVEEVRTLVSEHGAVALRGNHDQRLVDLIRSGDSDTMDKFLAHGGQSTVISYLGLDCEEADVGKEMLAQARTAIMEKYSHHIDFLANLPLYDEDAGHIYVHAGLNPAFRQWKDQPPHDFMYIKDNFYRHPTVVEKTVVFGHTKAMDIHNSAEIWFGNGKIAIDGGCAYGMQLNALEIDVNGTYRTWKTMHSG